MMDGALTTKQLQVLQAIKNYQMENGYPPTVRELAEILGHSSTAGIHKILTTLRRKGYLKKTERGKSRSLGVIDQDPALEQRIKAYPILGSVVAGSPELALENREGELLLDLEWAGDGETFLLRVKGYSMVDADIRDGDLLVVQKSSTCHNGDIVIALLDDEATVKRFYKERDRYRLQPENPSMQPIYIQRDDPSFRIIGKVKGLLRKF